MEVLVVMGNLRYIQLRGSLYLIDGVNLNPKPSGRLLKRYLLTKNFFSSSSNTQAETNFFVVSLC